MLAGVFVFSGFVKSIDPQGTLYKLQDYLTAFGMPYLFPESVLYGCSVLLGCVEFCLGIYLFFGIRRRITPRLMLAVMSFMTPLTLWLAIDNPISDCGCFGDAFILSNWETFWKNILLLIAAISIFKWRKCISPLVTTRFDWLIALYSWIYIFAIITYCMWHLPVFDFRPYYIGADIRAGMEIPEGKEPTLYETRFIMQKDGVEKEFSLEEKIFTENDIHIHVPEGAVNKDGPSAGITITTALISLLTNKAVDKNVAMTGEITLRGRVLGIGGLKEKIIGAHRAGIKKIILPQENEKDLDEVPIDVKNSIEFIFVKNYKEIYKEIFRLGKKQNV